MTRDDDEYEDVTRAVSIDRVLHTRAYTLQLGVYDAAETSIGVRTPG